ncbi:MAG: hypothetical protein GF320_10050 [Armatimonadia bacterium]|nr:hypothetical protein [Armatimonadia bacterium]
MGFLWVMSAQPSLSAYGIRTGPSGWSGLLAPDKLAHIGAYAVLVLLAFRIPYGRRLPLLSRAPVFFAVAFALAHGLADEVHQVYVPGRMVSMWDLVADSIGAFGMGFVLVLWTDRPRGPSRVGDAVGKAKRSLRPSDAAPVHTHEQVPYTGPG